MLLLLILVNLRSSMKNSSDYILTKNTAKTTNENTTKLAVEVVCTLAKLIFNKRSQITLTMFVGVVALHY